MNANAPVQANAMTAADGRCMSFAEFFKLPGFGLQASGFGTIFPEPAARPAIIEG